MPKDNFRLPILSFACGETDYFTVRSLFLLTYNVREGGKRSKRPTVEDTYEKITYADCLYERHATKRVEFSLIDVLEIVTNMANVLFLAIYDALWLTSNTGAQISYFLLFIEVNNALKS